MVAGLAFCVAQLVKPSFFGQVTTRNEKAMLSAKQASAARMEAMEQGRKHYNGRPCYRCGGTLRRASCSACVECTKRGRKK